MVRGKVAQGHPKPLTLMPTHLAAKRLPEAAETLMRFALGCDASGSRNSQCKAYLGACSSSWAAGSTELNLEAVMTVMGLIANESPQISCTSRRPCVDQVS